jgi:hypothetical protein
VGPVFESENMTDDEMEAGFRAMIDAQVQFSIWT